MSINESLKKTIDDLDIDRRVEDLNRLAQKVKAQVGTLAADNRDKVDGWVTKATDVVDSRTEGKYHDKMQKFSVALGSAVDKVAEQRPEARMPHAPAPRTVPARHSSPNTPQPATRGWTRPTPVLPDRSTPILPTVTTASEEEPGRPQGAAPAQTTWQYREYSIPSGGECM